MGYVPFNYGKAQFKQSAYHLPTIVKKKQQNKALESRMLQRLAKLLKDEKVSGKNNNK